VRIKILMKNGSNIGNGFVRKIRTHKLLEFRIHLVSVVYTKQVDSASPIRELYPFSAHFMATL